MLPEKTFFIAREAEDGKRHGNGHVHPHLPDIGPVHEGMCGSAALRKDSSAITPLVSVHECERLIERLDFDNDLNGPENFLSAVGSGRGKVW